ncbi:MAG: 3-oxoadipate enol-lactonase [Steroidobacteraceae bacterium]
MDELSFSTTGDACKLAYRFDGNPGYPVLMLSNSIGTDLHMWDGQIPTLTRQFRVLRYDLRGHGTSDVPAGAYSMDRLGRDVLELLDDLQLRSVRFCGLSLGGMVGQWLGIHAPERIERLALCHTAPFIGPTAQWAERIAGILAADPAATAEGFLKNWFPTPLLEADSRVIEAFRATLRATDPRGIAGCMAAVRDMDMRRTDALIACPTLVIGGRFDTVTLPEHSEQIAATIPGAKLVMLPAVHLSNVEMPEAFERVLLDFLSV